MRYTPPSKNLYIQNRANFRKLMEPGAMAVFHSNDQMPTGADGLMPFRQNNDLLYLSGIDQEETILLVFPDFALEEQREVLFIKETSELIAIWHGHKFTKEEARELSGIQTVHWLSEFDLVFNTLMAEAKKVYLNTNEHIRAVVEVETRDARYARWCQQKYPAHTYLRSAPLMHQLRAIKSKEEIVMMQKACDITNDAFRRVLKFTKPGVKEYEIQAEFMHEFLNQGSRGFAYEPIIGSGYNACVLHYIANNDVVKEGEVILMDVGAEYGNYNADMTRCVPVSGRFSQRQKDVYNAVLHVKNEAQKMLRPGNVIPEYHKEVGLVMQDQLLKLGLIDKTDIKNQDPANPAYRKYFMHGTSHHLGLDVHDVGNIYRKMEEGMVFTCEPGIYIPEENLGIRIEDNLVIRKDGLDNLMGDIPIEVEEIEEIMNA
ncbi:MAG: aminopeptidase P family protein [Cyclobacteriaceae bacterium]|nr:aminopeptidase P family protein [Cyclobacteriaceae bacterium]